MLLVAAARIEAACILALWGACACREGAPAPAEASTRPSATISAPPRIQAAPSASATIAIPHPSLSPSSSAAAAAPDYPAVAKVLTGPCVDPQALLAIRKEYDRSGRVWLQQALLAHPELELVSERPSKGAQVQVYETIYGVKNFSRSYPGQPRFSEALIARCADVETCNRLAAMFHAVSPRDGVVVSCGAPPGITGGFSLVRELAPERMRLPDSVLPAEAACARLHACAVRVADPRLAQLDCAALRKPELARCARADSCNAVITCLAGATG